MAYNNGRAGEQLTRKDTLFAAINSLGLLDKRTVAKKLNIESVNDIQRVVTEMASNYSDYIENGRADNGSADQTLLECDSCLNDFQEFDSYDIKLNGEPSIVCRRCFELILAESRQEGVQHESV